MTKRRSKTKASVTKAATSTSSSASMSSRNRAVLGSTVPTRISWRRPPTSWGSRSIERTLRTWPQLPAGRLYANGRGFVPNIRQSLYSDLIVELVAAETQPLPGTANDKDGLPAARGLPQSWDEIGPGHLVIAQ